ncbi:MAG: hypothetical protein ACJAZ3_000801 [Sphingobacteriales bacterium]|jgi:hypothetical protein
MLKFGISFLLLSFVIKQLSAQSLYKNNFKIQPFFSGITVGFGSVQFETRENYSELFSDYKNEKLSIAEEYNFYSPASFTNYDEKLSNASDINIALNYSVIFPANYTEIRTNIGFQQNKRESTYRYDFVGSGSDSNQDTVQLLALQNLEVFRDVKLGVGAFLQTPPMYKFITLYAGLMPEYIYTIKSSYVRETNYQLYLTNEDPVVINSKENFNGESFGSLYLNIQAGISARINRKVGLGFQFSKTELILDLSDTKDSFISGASFGIQCRYYFPNSSMNYFRN